MAQHIKIVGILHIVLGCFGILAALIIFLVFGGIAGFLTANPGIDSDAAAAIPVIAAVGTGIMIIILILSVPGVIIGFGLVNFRPWARVWGIVLSALDLFHFPFGTAVGVYGLWALLQPQTEALFRPQGYPVPYSAPPPPTSAQGR